MNDNVEVVQKAMSQHLGTTARNLSTAAVSFGLGTNPRLLSYCNLLLFALSPIFVLPLLKRVRFTLTHGLSCYMGDASSAAFWQAWDVTLLMLAVVPVLAAINYAGFRMMEKYSKNTAAFYGKANGVALECLGNIRTVAAYTIEEESVRRYSGLLESPMRKGIREVRWKHTSATSP